MSKANIGNTTNRIQVSTRVLKKREQGEKEKKKREIKRKKNLFRKKFAVCFLYGFCPVSHEVHSINIRKAGIIVDSNTIP